MSVTESTPQDGELDRSLPALLQPELLIQLEGDYSEGSAFGMRTLEVTAETVRVRETNGVVAFQIPVSEIKEARNEPLVGGGRLEITAKNGDFFPIITYSSTVSAKFSEAARGIEQLSKGEPLSIDLKKERTRCAKCNRLLPEKDGICPACVNRTKTMGRIAGYLKPYRKQAITLTILSLVMTGLSLAPPAIQGALIDGVLTPHRNIGLLWSLMGIWLATLAINSALQIMNGRLIAFLAGSIAADLRSSLYRAIEFLQLSYFDKKQVGAITSRVTQDTDRVWGFLVDGLPYLVTNVLLIIGLSVFMLSINVKLTLCILAPLPVVFLLSGIFWKPVSQILRVRQGRPLLSHVPRNVPPAALETRRRRGIRKERL